MTILLHHLTAADTLCYGATMGQQHIAPLVDALRGSRHVSQVILLDFAGIEVTNASYLKATALWLLRGGIAHADVEDERIRTAPAGLEAFNVFPVAMNLSGEVREEFDTLLRSERLPFLAVESSEGDRIVRAVQMGHLEPALEETMTALSEEQRATATALCERYPRKPPIKPSAWSNRLSELHRLRLARREREGRQWFYMSLADEVQHG